MRDKGNYPNIVESLNLIIAIITLIFGYFFIDRHVVKKTIAETELIKNQIETLDKNATKLLTQLSLKKEKLSIEGNKISNQISKIEEQFRKRQKQIQLSKGLSSTSLDIVNIIKLLYPQLIMKYAGTCLLDTHALRITYLLKNAGQLPLSIDYPIVKINNNINLAEWQYDGNYNDYPAKEQEWVYFTLKFKGRIPKVFKSKIIVKYRAPDAVLEVLKSYKIKKSLMAKLAKMTKRTYTLHYSYKNDPKIPKCK